MIILDMQFEDGASQRQQFALPAMIGRQKDCAIHLRSWRVAKQHARLLRRHVGVFLEDLGSLAGTVVNGLRITEYGPLTLGDEILIGPCRMIVQDIGWSDRAGMQCKPPDLLGSNKSDETAAMYPSGLDPSEPRLQRSREGAVADAAATSELIARQAGEADTGSLSLSRVRPDQAAIPDTQLPAVRARHLQLQLHSRLLQALDLRRKDVSQMSDEALRLEAAGMLDRILAEDLTLSPDINRERLKQDVLNEAIGLGPLEPLLADPVVTEIMVNRYDELYIEKAGRLTRHAGAFSSEQSVLSVIERIVAPLGRRIDESSPMVDARLKDGSRVNAIIPPIALRGASLTIRKFPDFRPGMSDLLRLGSLDSAMQQFLELCVANRMNLIVSGGTGSGKTTLLNILSNCIPEHERIITIEDAAELRLNHEHLVSLEARPANTEGKGQIVIRDLVRNALRMRPDRIVVGECRGAEAFDMLSAMNTGHEGSLTTLHANSPRDALARLETMILMAGMALPLAAIREQITSSIDFIIQQSRLSCGRRVITSITEVCGLESGIIKSQEIFRFDRKGTGAFVGQGMMPDCFDALRDQGVNIDMSMFNQRTAVTPGANTFVSSAHATITGKGFPEGHAS